MSLSNAAHNYHKIKERLPSEVTLIAVSKTKPIELIQEVYDAGCRHFGENKVQELVPKYEALPKDIQWHLIGHLQSNKVKYIAPFVGLIHSIDSFSLLKEVNKQAAKVNRVIDVLLQVHIASEETKFGFGIEDLNAYYIHSQTAEMHNIRIVGLMGMASFTEDNDLIEREFGSLAELYTQLKAALPQNDKFNFSTLSMGMSSDWGLALKHGSTHLRVGSTIFGSRL